LSLSNSYFLHGLSWFLNICTVVLEGEVCFSASLFGDCTLCRFWFQRSSMLRSKYTLPVNRIPSPFHQESSPDKRTYQELACIR
jgi:hypothetical protein